MRNEVEDVPLRAALQEVEVDFQEDEQLYLVCANSTLAEIIEKKKEKIDAILQKATGKSFALQFTTKEAFEKWQEAQYGKREDTAVAEEDADFASLLGSYFPEADIEE